MSKRSQLSSDEIMEIIRNAVSDVAEVDLEYLDDDMNLFEDLGLDSMLFLQALTVVEEKLQIKIIGDKYTLMPTISESALFIEKLLKE